LTPSSTNNSETLEIRYPASPEDLGMVRDLFREYERSLAFDLCFQDFDGELARLPGAYAPPEGRLLLVTSPSGPVGCAGIRKIADGVCELKRMYVRPEFRGRNLGRNLATRLIAEARSIGYRTMRLDTVGTMVEAIRLYRSLGFHTIDPYYRNPIPGAVYMELDLFPRTSTHGGNTEQH
jgi:putative acetyltransferase